jgi:MFS family permease
MPTESAPATSAWAPLRIGAFRALFIAALTSNIGTWMQTVGAQWFLVERHASPTVVALVQTATLSPTLLLAVFAGALADRVDRRHLLIVVQVYAAIAAAVLTGLTIADVLNAASLLVLLFAIGCAAALTTPAWQAIQPELVPRDQLQAAASLSGVAVDAARAIGPPIAGLLVAAAGPEAVFAINAVSFVALIVALLAWRRPTRPAPDRASFVEAVRAGVRYIRQSPVARRILLRAAMFAFPASALWALLPITAHDQWQLRAIGYGAVLGTVGTGAVLGAVVMARLRATYSANALLAIAAFVIAAGLLAGAYVPLGPAVVLLLLSGVAWIAALTTLTVAAQLSFPAWVRARGLAIYLVILIGSQALGSLLWGFVAARFGLAASLTAPAVMLILAAASQPMLPLLSEGSQEQDSALGGPSEHA